uniref:F-box domain-containing protein n=1 Tax=Oryza punctata TaxID=4537 RepID=A0A0E0MDL2_ORYPU
MPPTKRGRNTGQDGGEDRIGALPDEFLHHLLSFLPARDAVQTCVLAHRWRDLWKSATGLRIGGDEEETARVREIREFVDHLLLLRGCAPLDMCELKFWFDSEEDDDEDDEESKNDARRVNLWIRSAVASKVRILVLNNICNGSFELDDLPLVSRHLTRLELFKLELTNRFCDFSSCLVLEHVKIANSTISCPRIISSSTGSLLCLIITRCSLGVGSSFRTKICVPSLVSLQLDSNSNMTPLLESMPSLAEATVTVTAGCCDVCGNADSGYCGFEDCKCCYPIDDRNCVLLKGLSEAKNLALTAECRTFIFKRDLQWCPTFSKLKTLLLNDHWCVSPDFHALSCILKHSPVLEKLTLHLFSKGPEHKVELNGSFGLMDRPAEIPEHLNIVEVKCKVVDPFDGMQSSPPPAKRRRREIKDDDARSAASDADADRISALPDDVLHRVLSPLPAHEVVRTCVLSRRWRDVWRSAPAVRVTAAGGWWDTATEFNAFLDGLLRLRRCDDDARLDSFVLDLDAADLGFPGYLPGTVNEQHISRALRRAVRHNVRVLRLRLRSFQERMLLVLPNRPFVSRHLTTLELTHVSVTSGILDFSECPSLVDLTMNRCYIGAQISCLSLNRLIITDCASSDMARIWMSLPGLRTMEITLHSGRGPLFLESMPLLESATVALRSGCHDWCCYCMSDHCGNRSGGGCYGYIRSDRMKIFSLLERLSEATNLCLLAHPGMFIFNRDLYWCPTFNKLKTLELNDWCVDSDLNALFYFLQHSPVLEMLTLHLSKVRKDSFRTTGSYKPLGQLASDRLKRIEINHYDFFDERVRKIFKILSTYVTPLQSPPAAAKRRRRDAKDEDAPSAASDADRLSALPDDILHILLSLLPAHEAVRTCALGRRWRDVWRSVPAVRVTGAGGWDSAAKFTAFLDGLLRCLRRSRRGDASPRLESCVFDLNEIDFAFVGLLLLPSNHLHLSRAIWRAARHEVRVLRFRLFTSEQRLQLPDLSLVSNHLTTLELTHVRVNDRVLDFSSCPSLQDLIMNRCYIGALQMSSESLNRLIMTDCGFLLYDRTRMSLPGIVALKITLLSGMAPFLERMPLLETAIVSLHCDCGDKWGWNDYIRSDKDKNISRLLQGLSEATNLCLLAHPRVCIFNTDLKWCPTFSKLKNLVLNDWCVTSNLNALIYLLQLSPILERLTLHLSKVRKYSLRTTERYKPREQSFAFDHLKKVEFMCDEVDDRVRKISKILSTYVTPLQVDVRTRCEVIQGFFPPLTLAMCSTGMSPESKKTFVEGGDDRISFLPTALLQHLLSFLQAKEVVRTCVLARRWRHLWKSMPVLRDTGAGGARAFHTFMDHLLLLRDRSPLEACMFDFNVFSKDDMPIVNLWIRYVLLCQVRVLTLAIVGHQLTDLPVVSPILTRLEPSHLSANGKFLDFSSCPALKELKMTNCEISADKISSKSLKRLSICECKFKSKMRTRISVPSLLFLKLIAVKGRTPFLEDMPVLVTAKVLLLDFSVRIVVLAMILGCVLLKGLADATNLELIADPEVFILKRDLRWCPTFTKLKTLLLSQWFESSDHRALICILQHSQVLEKLTLQLSKKPVINVRSRAIYNLMEQPFTSENLKTVEVKCQDIDQRAHKLMKSLNSYGIPLERINIQQTNQFYECKFSIDNLYSYTFVLHLGKINQRNSLTRWPRRGRRRRQLLTSLPVLHSKLHRFGARHLFDVMPHPRRGDDRLGALPVPDEALQHVLSFLPLPEAVRTGALARRWRHLWKSMPVLRITGEGRVLNRRGVRRLNRFVNHLLLLRDRSARLDACEIELGTFRSQDDPQINLWIRHVLLCEARVLRVHLSIDNNSFELEDLALVSRHLARLELSNVVLKNHFLNFSSCPALEELVTRNCHIEAEEILSESLKLLTTVDCVFSSYPRTRISVPSLVALELTEPWGSTPVLESMPSLLTASIKLTDCDDHCGKEEFGGSCDDNACDNCGANGGNSGDYVLFDGLSEAKRLELIAKPRVFIFRRDLMWCPTFGKLKTLLLNEWSVAIDLVALICFLQHTPVLEKLTLQLCEAPVNWMENEGSYDLTENPLASKQLKVVDVKCEKFDPRVHKIIMIFSTYGINIEQIYIQRSVIHSEEPADDSGAGPSRVRTPPISTSENAQLKSMIDQIRHYWHSNSNSNSSISYPSCSGGSRSSVISQRSFRNILLLPFLRGLHKLIFILQGDPCINLWIRHALLCQARALQVHLSIDNDSYELEDVALVSQAPSV